MRVETAALKKNDSASISIISNQIVHLKTYDLIENKRKAFAIAFSSAFDKFIEYVSFIRLYTDNFRGLINKLFQFKKHLNNTLAIAKTGFTTFHPSKFKPKDI